MWKMDHKESWVPKNWCFWTLTLVKTLESPLACKKIKPSMIKEYSLEALISPWGCRESDSVLSNWTELNWTEELESYSLLCSNFETFKCFLYLGAMKCVWFCENKCLIKCLCEKSCICWQGCCRFLVILCPRHCKGKESACQCSISKRYKSHLWVGKIAWRKKWQPLPVFLSG